MGNPDPRRFALHIVERQNLTIRMQMRRLTRLTNAFSKKWENLWAAYCLHFAYYNFCRIHKTLRVTPAMESRAHRSRVGSGGTAGVDPLLSIVRVLVVAQTEPLPRDSVLDPLGTVRNSLKLTSRFNARESSWSEAEQKGTSFPILLVGQSHVKTSDVSSGQSLGIPCPTGGARAGQLLA